MLAHITAERLIVALLVSTVFHTVTITGTGFIATEWLNPAPKTESMQVLLVQKSTEEKPDKADFLAQANSEGSGSSEAMERPSTPLIAPFPDPYAREIATPPPPKIARAQETPETQVLATANETPFTVKTQRSVTEVKDPAPIQGDQDYTTTTEQSVPATLLMQQAMANVASMQAELDAKFNDFSNRTRSKHISLNTQEFKYATYMDQWRRKVEHIGNLNYPEAVRKEGLSGHLILEVGLKSSGEIESVAIKKSSGHLVLDRAARKIVHLAGPYAPFPDSIRHEVDTLYITGTWRFIQEGLKTSVQ